MRKYIITATIFLSLFLVSCENTPMVNETSALDFSTSEMITLNSTLAETTTSITNIPKYHTKVRKTEPLQTELPELQEKIDYYQKQGWGVPSKIVIEMGDQREVPYYDLVSGRLVDNGHIIYPERLIMLSNEEILENANKYPIFIIKEGDSLNLYSNDELVDSWKLVVIDLEQEYTDLAQFSSLEDLYMTMPKGTYYVYMHVSCYGDYIMYDNGDHLYDSKGSSRERLATEYMKYEAYFILELVD